MHNLPSNVLRSAKIVEQNHNTFWWKNVCDYLLCLYITHDKENVRYCIARFRWSPQGYQKLVRTKAIYTNAILALDAFNVRREEFRNRGYVIVE